MQVTIPTVALKAAATVAATKDVRYYINGVHIRSEGGFIYIESTCGSAAYQDRIEGSDDIFSVIVPNDVLKIIGKSKSNEVSLTKLDGGKWQADFVTFTPIDGTFPSIDRVMPERKQGPEAHYNPDLITKCRNAMRIRMGEKHTHYRVSNGLMHRENDMYPRCAVMPLTLPQCFKGN